MVKVIKGASKKANKSDIDKQIKLEKLRAKNIKNRTKIKRKPKIKIGYRPSLSSNLQRTFGGVFGGQTRQSGSKQRVKEGPGRPRGDFKHRSPFTGQPIPATVFYKQIKEFRRLQEQRANQVDQQQVQQLAKRGIPPQQAKQIVDVRQLRNVGIQPQIQNGVVPYQVQQIPQPIPPQLSPEMQRQIFIQQQLQQLQTQQNQRPNPFASQVPSNLPRYGKRGQFIEGDAFGKPRIKTFGDGKSFWN